MQYKLSLPTPKKLVEDMIIRRNCLAQPNYKKPILVLMKSSKFPKMKSPQAIIHLSSSSLIYFLFYVLAITCLTSATVSASNGGNETDYLALLSFKSKITHDPYKVLTSWNHSFNFCDWSGISCGKRLFYGCLRKA